MKVKKIVTVLLLSAALLGCMSATLMAAPDGTIQPGPTPTGSAEVVANIKNRYMVTIPESMDFGELATKGGVDLKAVTGTVSAKNVLIPKGKKLEVSIKPSELKLTTGDENAQRMVELQVTTPDGKTIPYDAGETSAVLTDFNGGEPKNTFTKQFTVSQAEIAGYVGEYKGTLNFIYSVK